MSKPLLRIRPLGPETDVRGEKLARADDRRDQIRAEIMDTFADHGFVRQPDKIDILVAAKAEVDENYEQIRQRFLVIGRKLLEVKRQLDDGPTFNLFVTRMVPFGRVTVVKLLAVADAVERGRLPEQGLPMFSSAYELASLAEPDLHEAKRIGLLNPTVSHRDLIAFKRARRIDDASDPRMHLLREKSSLMTEIARHEKELRRAQARLAEVERQLSERHSEQQHQ